jgi:peptidyl-prolyl cis-trans isomerase A (cyclophilin A)/peptidyl-prolyl cis-trans isomerase B (cyclophilin B)
MRERKDARPPIANEASNGLLNELGSVAMARTSAPDSATSQFFINLADNPALDHVPDDPASYGYAVFGRIRSGMEVVHKIESLPRGGGSGAFRDSPRPDVIIEAARRK